MRRHNKYYDLSYITNSKNVKISPPFSWYTIVCTWFYIGRIPIAPGTLGAIAAYPLYYLLLISSLDANQAIYSLFIVLIFLTIISHFAIKKFQKVTNTFDHRSIVVDEVIGQLLTLAISFKWLYSISTWINLPYHDLHVSFVIALIAFRYFDIKKPFFIGYIDRRWKNSFSVLLDDILAALLASCVIYVGYFIYGNIRGYI